MGYEYTQQKKVNVKALCGEYIWNLKIRNEWDMVSGVEG